MFGVPVKCKTERSETKPKKTIPPPQIKSKKKIKTNVNKLNDICPV